MFIEQAVAACFVRRSIDGFIYCLPADFPAFAGHFEGYPLLPAVCHISLCSDAAARLLGKAVELAALKRAKFMSPVLPGQEVEVRFTVRPDGWYFAEVTEVASKKKVSQLILQFAECKK